MSTTRRTTRSMSREKSIPIPSAASGSKAALGADDQEARSSKRRPGAQPKHSHAYGSLGRSPSPQPVVAGDAGASATSAIQTDVLTVVDQTHGEEPLPGIMNTIEEEDDDSVDSSEDSDSRGAHNQVRSRNGSEREAGNGSEHEAGNGGEHEAGNGSVTHTFNTEGYQGVDSQGNPIPPRQPTKLRSLGLDLLQSLSFTKLFGALVLLLTFTQIYRMYSHCLDLPWPMAGLYKGPLSFPNDSVPDITAAEYRDMVTRLAKVQYIPGISYAEYNSQAQRLDKIDIIVAKTANRVDSLGQQMQTVFSVNEREAHQRINYFALGLGTIIDPYLTSPTKQLKPISVFSGWRAWFFGSSFQPTTPGPIAALTPWSEVGDCWCAPPSGGKSQIAIMLGKKIIPDELVVEHIPRGASLNIGSAPKTILFFVQISDFSDMERAKKSMENQFGPGHTVIPAEGLEYQTERPLDDSWIQVGGFQYDINANRIAQGTQLEEWFTSLRIPVEKVVVQVVENWSGESGVKQVGPEPIDHVCLYNLKLYGKYSGELSVLSE